MSSAARYLAPRGVCRHLAAVARGACVQTFAPPPDTCFLELLPPYDINCMFSMQEAPLSPRDRAMRRVSSNLASCHATVQKLLIRQILTKSMV